MRARYVYERLSFERGQDPKRAMDVGHSHLFPEKTLFLDIYRYCEEDKFPGFQKLSQIYWDTDEDGNKIIEPKFIAYVSEGLDMYTVYLTLDEGVIAFHEYMNREGDWREHEFHIPGFDFWRRMMKANHISSISMDESQEFRRGLDPKSAMDIGLTSRQRYDSIAPGDIFRTLVDMPGIEIYKNLYIMVLETSIDSYRHMDVRYASSPNLDALKRNYMNMGWSWWRWSADFFTKCLEKEDHIDLDPQA
jgi:hypothetical protein